MPNTDRTEILSVELLDEYVDLVRTFRGRAKALGIHLGWHYPLDLAWIGSQLGDVEGKRILDAGAGLGVLQWWMAEQGAEVMSVDVVDRSDLSARFRLAYDVSGFYPTDLVPAWKLIFKRLVDKRLSFPLRLKGAVSATFTTLSQGWSRKYPGSVVLLRKDLSHLSEFPDDSFDAVVSVSALEHNDAEQLGRVTRELTRVLKPGGAIFATLAAAKDEDWYHEPSSGWCYTEETLKDAFSLQDDFWTNYADYDELFSSICDSKELEENLAPMLFETGNCGMPWGIWDPQYMPIGVMKGKTADSIVKSNG